MVKVYVDERERASGIPETLKELGVTVIFKHLDVGDYIPAEGFVIERKRLDDLVNSVYEGRFFDQVRRLSTSGSKAILLIEGDILKLKHITENFKAIEAALITAVLSFGLSVFYVDGPKHAAEFIKYIAEKYQEQGSKSTYVKLPTYRKERKPKTMDLRAWQIYILSSFPKIGPKLALRLLQKFGSLKSVLNAQVTELARVEGMNEYKAKLLKDIVEWGEQRKSQEGLSKFLSKNTQARNADENSQ